MANEYYDRNGRPGQGYANRDMDRGSRDWSDKAADEVRSWVGDDQAERRRDMDEMRENRNAMGYGRDADRASGYGRSYDAPGRRPGVGMDPRPGRSYDAYGTAGGYGAGRSYGRDADEDRGFLDKASDEVASWFGDKDAERRREMDKHRGVGPKGYVRSDERIKEDVSERLMDDGHLDASDVEVSVQDAEVTLTGTVADRFAKRHAEDLAERASGVKHVQNNLRVAGPGQTATTPLTADPLRDRGLL